jgi:hypothetical protein
MKTSTYYVKTKVALVIISVFFLLQTTQAQWSTSGSNVYYNGGNVGIGTSSPIKLLNVANTGSSPDLNLALTGPGPSILFSVNQTLPPTNWAKIGLATSAGHFSPTSQSGDFVISALTPGGSILFTTGSSTTEAFRVNTSGNVGIGTTSPTAKLHSKGTVRFENLPSGTGHVLVVDNSGNVYVSSTTARVATESQASNTENEITALQEKIEKLEKTIQLMQQQLSATNGSIEVNIIKSSSLEVDPNPATSGTTIKYSYPANSNSAFINISDVTGKLIKRIDIKKSNNSILNFSLGEEGVSAGVYVYALEVNGKSIATKKVVLTK